MRGQRCKYPFKNKEEKKQSCQSSPCFLSTPKTNDVSLPSTLKCLLHVYKLLNMEVQQRQSSCEQVIQHKASEGGNNSVNEKNSFENYQKH